MSPRRRNSVSDRMVAGLRSSGKTSLLLKMQAWNHFYDDIDATPLPPPSKHLRRYTFDFGHLETEFIDTPSSLYPVASVIVQELLLQVDAVIYMIDSCNPIRLPQARNQLKDLVQAGFSSERLLVVFTKTDCPQSMATSDLVDLMFPDVSEATYLTFERISLNSTTRAVNVIREFVRNIPNRTQGL